jgi:glutathione S-transferase
MPLTFYSAWYCPFAQRAWMTLLYKEIAFDYVEVDPYRESDWWLKISRGRSTVPVVVTSGHNGQDPITVVGSTRVVEYLDELTADFKPLFSDDLDTRTEQRFWVDHINERIVPPIYRYLGANEPGEEQDGARRALLDGLEALIDAMSPGGPFFAGETLTAIDLLMIPFAYRIATLLGHYRAFSVPTEGEVWERYAHWYEHMCAMGVFKATATDHEDYRHRLVEQYLSVSQGKKAP